MINIIANILPVIKTISTIPVEEKGIKDSNDYIIIDSEDYIIIDNTQ